MTLRRGAGSGTVDPSALELQNAETREDSYLKALVRMLAELAGWGYPGMIPMPCTL